MLINKTVGNCCPSHTHFLLFPEFIANGHVTSQLLSHLVGNDLYALLVSNESYLTFSCFIVKPDCTPCPPDGQHWVHSVSCTQCSPSGLHLLQGSDYSQCSPGGLQWVQITDCTKFSPYGLHWVEDTDYTQCLPCGLHWVHITEL